MKVITAVVSILSLSLAFASSAVAQAPKAYPVTLDKSLHAAEYALPVTKVKVRVVVEKETIRTGPYARFSQKFLGVIAPLSDKDIYTIKRAEIDYSDPQREEIVYSSLYGADLGVKNLSHVSNDGEFTKALPDKMALLDKSAEDMARDAANVVFKMRKKRQELVTGEAGEHVYGAGMQAAIDEMLRIESDYLSLFLGKQTTVTTIKEYEIVPEANKYNYIPFRFSATDGLLPENDLSASPIVLTMESKPLPQDSAKPSKTPSFFRVAAWTDCRLMNGSIEIANARIPIYQFGITVTEK